MPARHSDPETSHAAARNAKTQQVDNDIIAALLSAGEKGLTTREMEDVLIWPRVSVSPRMIILERERRVTRSTAKRRHPVSGATGIVWLHPEIAEGPPERIFLHWNFGHFGKEVKDRAGWNKERKLDTDIEYIRVRK